MVELCAAIISIYWVNMFIYFVVTDSIFFLNFNYASKLKNVMSNEK